MSVNIGPYQFKDIWRALLHVGNLGGGVDATLRAIQDAEGTVSVLEVSTLGVNITPGGFLRVGGVDVAIKTLPLNSVWIGNGANVQAAVLIAPNKFIARGSTGAAESKDITDAALALLGLSTNAAIFTAIKQAATEGTAGVVLLATTEEIAGGIVTGKAIDPAGLASLTATQSRRGLIEIGTLTEVNEAASMSLSVVPGTLLKGQANGVASLGPDAKVLVSQLPDAVLGALQYQAAWNAATNSPAIPAASAGNRGHYYKVSTAGTTEIDGEDDWGVGDWIVSNGVLWQKADNSERSHNDLVGVQGGNGTTEFYHVTADQKAGMDAATAPVSAGNRVLTAADVAVFEHIKTLALSGII